MTGQEIHQQLKSAFPERIGDFNELNASAYQQRMGSYVDVSDASYLRDVCLFLRDEPGFGFDNLMLLSTVDNGDGTLSVVYNIESTKLKQYVSLKVTLPVANAVVPSVTDVWASANWHEREGWDMMGIQFKGHPDLRRILLEDDYPGHPLRKDFKVPEYYHGMKVPY